MKRLFFVCLCLFTCVLLGIKNFVNKNVLYEQNYELKIDVPITSYENLNNIINDKIDYYVSNFKNSIDSSCYVNNCYSLIIYYDEYVYDKYLSYVLFVESFIGGAHPDHDIFTIVYDKDSDKVIDINYLISIDSDILNKFSIYSREKLMYDKGIVNFSMMMEGTSPNEENFSRFVFSSDGVLVYFPRYQVAPYSSGEFIVSIPYDVINNFVNK